MGRRATGMVFIGIAAFLYAVRYVSAAIYGSGTQGWSREMFSYLLDYVGTAPKTLSILALIVGILYLLWAEIGRTPMLSKETIRRCRRTGISRMDNTLSEKKRKRTKKHDSEDFLKVISIDASRTLTTPVKEKVQ